MSNIFFKNRVFFSVYLRSSMPLMEQWAARWPGDRYTMAPYDQIQAGFRNAIMGIELRR